MEPYRNIKYGELRADDTCIMETAMDPVEEPSRELRELSKEVKQLKTELKNLKETGISSKSSSGRWKTVLPLSILLFSLHFGGFMYSIIMTNQLKTQLNETKWELVNKTHKESDSMREFHLQQSAIKKDFSELLDMMDRSYIAEQEQMKKIFNEERLNFSLKLKVARENCSVAIKNEHRNFSSMIKSLHDEFDEVSRNQSERLDTISTGLKAMLEDHYKYILETNLTKMSLADPDMDDAHDSKRLLFLQQRIEMVQQHLEDFNTAIKRLDDKISQPVNIFKDCQFRDGFPDRSTRHARKSTPKKNNRVAILVPSNRGVPITCSCGHPDLKQPAEDLGASTFISCPSHVKLFDL